MKTKLPKIDAKKTAEWAASPEGQKSLKGAIESAQEATKKLEQRHYCDCCHCRANRLIG